jgi:hypothetical protein
MQINKRNKKVKKMFIAVMMVLMLATYSVAAEKKPIKEIDTNAFTTDTQVTLKGTGDNHLALAWWIPNEFWDSILSRDENIGEADKKAMLDTLSGVSLLAVVQADISSFGAFKFYSKEEIEENMMLSYSGSNGKKQKLVPVQNINPDLEVVLGTFRPILGAAMGNLGSNMHFYVLDDRAKSAPRLLDPYQKGQLEIQLAKKDKTLIDANIPMPINALFVPRKCPNGKEAHISWEYCPWTGKKLEE